jgi:hypothetical protein
MAPRLARRRVVTSDSEVEPSTPSQPQASTVQEQETFNLSNVSGGDDSDHNDSVGVNNPDLPPAAPKSSADIAYFFDKGVNSTVCRECRSVSNVQNPSIF